MRSVGDDSGGCDANRHHYRRVSPVITMDGSWGLGTNRDREEVEKGSDLESGMEVEERAMNFQLNMQQVGMIGCNVSTEFPIPSCREVFWKNFMEFSRLVGRYCS